MKIGDVKSWWKFSGEILQNVLSTILSVTAGHIQPILPSPIFLLSILIHFR